MKISVAIPTIAGRTKYLAAAIKTCVTQEDQDLEILVSDNSEGDARELVESFRDPRIRYIRPDRYLPMSAHWDFLVPHLTGDLVTIIGDDDGLMPGALRCVREMVQIWGMQPVRHALAQFGWPDFPSDELRNKYWFVHPPGGDTTVCNSKSFLRDLCEAKAHYAHGPAIYHNFVPRSVLQRIMVSGSTFHRPSPDVYSAVTIAAHTESFICTGAVLTVSGVSARSNGVSVRDGRSDGRRFIQEMRKPEYVMRYDSITVQLQTLDAILEAAERYSLPYLKDWIHYGDQFCAAANECLDFPDRARGLRQLLRVAIEAKKSGCLGYVLRNRGARLGQKLARNWRGHRDVLGNSPLQVPGLKAEVPGQVTDTYAASVYLRELLAQQRP